MKTKKEKMYQPTNINSLARYLETTSQTIYFYRKSKPKKYNLLMLGWKQKCEDELLS